jgi:hypothetical protein
MQRKSFDGEAFRLWTCEGLKLMSFHALAVIRVVPMGVVVSLSEGRFCCSTVRTLACRALGNSPLAVDLGSTWALRSRCLGRNTEYYTSEPDPIATENKGDAKVMLDTVMLISKGRGHISRSYHSVPEFGVAVACVLPQAFYALPLMFGASQTSVSRKKQDTFGLGSPWQSLCQRDKLNGSRSLGIFLSWKRYTITHRGPSLRGVEVMLFLWPSLYYSDANP